MKKSFLLVLLLLFAVDIVYSQSEIWTLKVPPRARNIYAVQLKSFYEFSIGGGIPANEIQEGRRFFSTTFDTGDSYEGFLDGDPFSDVVRDLEFVSQNLLFTVGDSGDIFRSLNGQFEYFDRVEPPASVRYRRWNSVEFLNATTGVVVGGDVLNGNFSSIIRTTDGGDTWEIIMDEEGALIQNVKFKGNTGIAVGNDGVILKSTDGGNNWIPFSNLPAGTEARSFTDVHMIDEATYIVVGGQFTSDSLQSILRTADGGDTWTAIRDMTSPMLNGVHFYNQTTGYAVGNNGVVLKSTDAGQSWFSLSLPGVTEAWYFHEVQFVDSTHGVIVGEEGAVMVAGDPMEALPIRPIVNTFIPVPESVTDSSIGLSGDVNARNTLTNIFFEFGQTVAYGEEFIPEPGMYNDSNVQIVNYPLSGLMPETEYNYRLVAYNDIDTVFGTNISVTTGRTLPIIRTGQGVILEDGRIVLTGTVNPRTEIPVDVFFEFGETEEYGQFFTPDESTFMGAGQNEVLDLVGEPLTEEIYHYRLAGVSMGDTIFGENSPIYRGMPYIPNFDFELWDSNFLFSPLLWTTQGMVTRLDDAVDGDYAVELQAASEIDPGALLKGGFGQMGPIGGVPFNDRPDSIAFHAKYDIDDGDAALSLVLFKKDGMVIAQNVNQIMGSSNGNWEELKFKLEYPTEDDPDTLILGFTSTFTFGPPPFNVNSVLALDDIRFINSNEVLENKSFEDWESDTSIQLSHWASQSSLIDGVAAFSATPSQDAFSGSTSAKIRNIIGIGGNQTLYGQIVTGSENQFARPSFPVRYRHQKLTGYYKAIPEGDTITIVIGMYRDGLSIGNGSIEITEEQTTFRPFSVDIEYFSEEVPDSAHITIRTLKGSEPIGNSCFFVDYLNFDAFVGNSDSLLTSTSDAISAFDAVDLYPNPVSHQLQLDMRFDTELTDRMQLHIYDLKGGMVRQIVNHQLNGSQYHTRFDVSDLDRGVYILVVDLEGSNSFIARKFIKY